MAPNKGIPGQNALVPPHSQPHPVSGPGTTNYCTRIQAIIRWEQHIRWCYIPPVAVSPPHTAILRATVIAVVSMHTMAMQF